MKRERGRGRARGQIVSGTETPVIPPLRGGGGTLYNMHRQFQRVCIIEKSKWVQDEHHASLIVNVITVSGKTAVGGNREIIEIVKSKRLPCLLSSNCYCLVKPVTEDDNRSCEGSCSDNLTGFLPDFAGSMENNLIHSL